MAQLSFIEGRGACRSPPSAQLRIPKDSLIRCRPFFFFFTFCCSALQSSCRPLSSRQRQISTIQNQNSPSTPSALGDWLILELLAKMYTRSREGMRSTRKQNKISRGHGKCYILMCLGQKQPWFRVVWFAYNWFCNNSLITKMGVARSNMLVFDIHPLFLK